MAGGSVDQRFRASFHPVDLAGRAWINEGGGRPLSIDLRGAGSVKGAASTRRVCIAGRGRKGGEQKRDRVCLGYNNALNEPRLAYYQRISRSVARLFLIHCSIPAPRS